MTAVLRKLFTINGIFVMSVVVFVLWTGAALGFIYVWLPNFVKGETVTILDFSGLSAAEARERASQLGVQINFAATQTQHDSAIPAGHVISHSPGPRQVVKKSRPIRFTMSLGPEQVETPDVRQRTLREASFEITVVGLRIRDVAYAYSDAFPEVDRIIATTPGPFETVPRGAPVDVLISRGARPYQFQMPNLIGMTFAEAQRIIESRGLSLRTVHREPSPRAMPDETLAQSPAPGETIMSGSTVTLTVNERAAGAVSRLEIVTHRVGGSEDEQTAVRIVIQDETGRHIIYHSTDQGGKNINLPRTVTGEATLYVYENDMENPVREEPLR